MPVGVGCGEGAVPPPPKNFGMFSLEMVHFDAFWSTFRPTTRYNCDYDVHDMQRSGLHSVAIFVRLAITAKRTKIATECNPDVCCNWPPNLRNLAKFQENSSL